MWGKYIYIEAIQITGSSGIKTNNIHSYGVNQKLCHQGRGREGNQN